MPFAKDSEIFYDLTNFLKSSNQVVMPCMSCHVLQHHVMSKRPAPPWSTWTMVHLADSSRACFPPGVQVYNPVLM